MSASARPLHVVFGFSAAGSLREGLRLAGRDDEVTALGDDLSYGPIDSDDPMARRDAVEDMLEVAFDDDYFEGIDTFWRTALDASRPRTVWFSRWSTKEYCGFLAWLRRNRDAPFALVDVSDLVLPDDNAPEILQPVGCTHMLHGQQFAKHGLWNSAILADSGKLGIWATVWNRLHSENAPLRVISSDGLVSAPADHFDADILACAETRWTHDNRVVGLTLARTTYESDPGHHVHQCGDFVLFARLRALVEQGALEGLGALYERDFKVRLPAS